MGMILNSLIKVSMKNNNNKQIKSLITLNRMNKLLINNKNNIIKMKYNKKKDTKLLNKNSRNC